MASNRLPSNGFPNFLKLCYLEATLLVKMTILFLPSLPIFLWLFLWFMWMIFLAGSDISEMTSRKSFLDQQFKIRDLGLVHYFLGLEIIFHDFGYLITQHTYTSDLLEEFQCSHFIPVASPLDP